VLYRLPGDLHNCNCSATRHCLSTIDSKKVEVYAKG